MTSVCWCRCIGAVREERPRCVCGEGRGDRSCGRATPRGRPHGRGRTRQGVRPRSSVGAGSSFRGRRRARPVAPAAREARRPRQFTRPGGRPSRVGRSPDEYWSGEPRGALARARGRSVWTEETRGASRRPDQSSRMASLSRHWLARTTTARAEPWPVAPRRRTAPAGQSARRRSKTAAASLLGFRGRRDPGWPAVS